MQVADFDFDLPKELIARYPLAERSAGRLLCLDKSTHHMAHRDFRDLPTLLSAKDLLVFNNTKVIPARWYGQKSSGGRVEILLERILDHHRLVAHIRANKSLRLGSELILDEGVRVIVGEREGSLYHLECQDARPVSELIDHFGHMPLPPYMQRQDEVLDKSRYQTVYAEHQGAVAAPTAGLHFDQNLLDELRRRHIDMAFVTLHVGAGTFAPVRAEVVTDHVMHAENLEVSDVVCQQVEAAKARGGRVIAVGTTSVRALETAAANGVMAPYYGDTRLFIYPGYTFRCVDAMITNFHLPKSTLLMLVCALGGYSEVMAAYRQAREHRYRFYSYGDAMWVG